MIKKTIFTFFLLGAVSSLVFSQTELVAQVKPQHKKAKKPFKSSFTGDEDQLYLNIELEKGLVFADKYIIGKSKNGLRCEISSKPVEGSESKVKEITFTVDLINDQNNNRVHYEISSAILYEDKVENGQLVSDIKKETKKGYITNPRLDVEIEPEFYTATNGEKNSGVIQFKNAFPYSKIKK